MTLEQQIREAFEELYLRATEKQGWLEELRDAHEAALDRLVAERDEARMERMQARSDRDGFRSLLDECRGREAELLEALTRLLDATDPTHSMPGINDDGSVSTDTMARTLARAALAAGVTPPPASTPPDAKQPRLWTICLGCGHMVGVSEGDDCGCDPGIAGDQWVNVVEAVGAPSGSPAATDTDALAGVPADEPAETK